jgi:sigma-E factor negative regulatory protein RseB
MRQASVLFKFVVVAFSFIAYTAYAQTSDRQSDKRDAQNWLRKIQTAALRLNYSGTFIYQQGSQVRTSRITHLMQRGDEVEKLEVLDGKPREYIRNNEEIVYYVPETKTLLVEKRVAPDVFPAILKANPVELANYYNIKKDDSGRVAGFDCQVISLEPKDDLRYGYKLWAEKNSGLLLRAQTLNENSVVVEQISFTQLKIGNIDRNSIKSSYPNTKGWRVENTVMSQANLSGWSVKGIPPGFKKVRELKRLVSDSPGAASSNGHPEHREVEQIVFSDGLAAISVFIEPSTQSKTEGSLQQGALNIIGKRQGDFWLTIVGEVPSVAIRQVANSIEFKSK